jgi:hypothetical protein
MSSGSHATGWPITVQGDDNDGRQPVAWLPELIVEGVGAPVIQVIAESSGEVLYTLRARANRFQPPVYGTGTYTIKIGKDRPDGQTLAGLRASEKAGAGSRTIKL